MNRYVVALGMAIVVLSVASAAFGQDAATVAADPSSLIPGLVAAGGQPAALLFLGWMIFGRGGLTLTVRLSDEDRAALRGATDQAATVARLDERVKEQSGEIVKLRDRSHEIANRVAGIAAAG